MPDEKDPKALRLILAGQSRHTGEFHLDLTNRSEKGELEPLPEFLVSAAGQIIQRVEPYAAALAMLHDLHRRQIPDAKNPEYIALRNFAQSELTSEIGHEFDESDHAAFHNLIGLADLLAHDDPAAETSFQRSAKADPQLGVPLTNLALQYVSAGRFDHAVQEATTASRTKAVRQTPFSLANAYTVMGLALWGKKDLPGAARAFRQSVTVYPNCFWGYYYWSVLLAGAGQSHDAEILRDRAEMALGIFENYPESALMYFKVLPEQGFALKPIDFGRARHVADLEAQ
jgi:tetratricopeptide (TPR) repeat protein